MPLIHHILVWLIVLAICIPLTLVAWSSRQLARDIARTADYEPKTIDEGPMINECSGFCISLRLLLRFKATRPKLALQQ